MISMKEQLKEKEVQIKEEYLQKRDMSKIKKGDIYYVDLSGAKGSEQKNLRPCVIVQNNVGNKHSRTTIVAPITNYVGNLPTHVKLTNNMVIADNGKKATGTILLEQLRTVDKRRFAEKRGRVKKQYLNKIDKAMMISLGIC